MNIKLEEIENIGEEERYEYLDKFLKDLDELEYEIINRNYDIDEIMERYNWKFLEMEY